MGPRSDERGNNLVLLAEDLNLNALQWGRAQMSAEIPATWLNRDPWDDASMGPRSDERGNKVVRLPSGPGFEKLQWGRAQMSAEIDSPARVRASNPCCFNGAALR